MHDIQVQNVSKLTFVGLETRWFTAFRKYKTWPFKVITILCCSWFLTACTHIKTSESVESAFRVYTSNGELVNLDAVLERSSQSQVTFLGESHDDPVAHFLEVELLKASWSSNLVLSLEMFESDVQYVLDEYLQDQISETHFLKSTRAWDHYDTDYKSLIEFIKEKEGRVIAANAPRRYVNRVSRLGKDSLLTLSDKAKSFLPPLPFADASVAYAERFNALMADSLKADTSPDREGEGEGESESTEAEHENMQRQLRMLQAQSLWDASMAWSIAKHLNEFPKDRVLQINGKFHSDQAMGILEHLDRYRPSTSTLVVSIISSTTFPDFDPIEMTGQGDFILVTDASLSGR